MARLRQGDTWSLDPPNHAWKSRLAQCAEINDHSLAVVVQWHLDYAHNQRAERWFRSVDAARG
jgi:hypothetical protein